MSKSRIRMLAAAAVMIMSVTAVIALGATGASAATTASPPKAVAKGAILCSGDVCVQNDGDNSSGNTAYITEWAYDATFFGHFELTDVAGDVRNSVTQTWYAGGRGVTFTIPVHCGGPVNSDQYAATAWRDIGGKEYFNGQVIFGGVC